MVLGTPERVLSVITPAFSGVDGQTSMLFCYASGAHALLTSTLFAKTPTRAAIVGTDARIEIDGDFYRPSSFTLIAREGEPRRFEVPHTGGGLRHQADEVARCLRGGHLESPVMPLDESVSIMATMDQVRAGRGGQLSAPLSIDCRAAAGGRHCSERPRRDHYVVSMPTHARPVTTVFDVIWHALRDSLLMAWEVWWALALGFFALRPSSRRGCRASGSSARCRAAA